MFMHVKLPCASPFLFHYLTHLIVPNPPQPHIVLLTFAANLPLLLSSTKPPDKTALFELMTQIGNFSWKAYHFWWTLVACFKTQSYRVGWRVDPQPYP